MKSLKEQGYDDINIGRVLQNLFCFLEIKNKPMMQWTKGTAYSDLPDPT